VRRGFKQTSIVVLSDTPFVGLLKQIVRVVGPQYFELELLHGAGDVADAVLEAAGAEMARWPRAVPGVSLELPLLGELLRFDVPWTAMHSYRVRTR
jgi:hypothetical protein